jgi:Signal transduction histidine kinase
MKILNVFFQKLKIHLWIKIYSVVFISMIFLVLILIKIWQYSNINYLFNKEKAIAIKHQKYVSEILYNALSFNTILKSDKETLTIQLKKAVDSAYYYELGDFALFDKEEVLLCSYQEPDDMDRQLLSQEPFDEECHVEKYKHGKIYYMKTISELTIQGSPYFLITTSDISDIYSYQNTLIYWAVFVCGIGGVIIALIFLGVFKVCFQPLADISENVKIIASGKYDRRISVKRRDELGELACSVNDMAQAVGDNVKSLQELADEQRRFIDNLTHEMKTPLTSIISFADIIQIDGNITLEKAVGHARVIAKEGRRLNLISQKLMDFIHIGKISEEDKIEVSVKSLFEDISIAMKPILEKKNICLKKEIQDYTLKIDYELFKTMICNYVDNAMKASQENGIIEIKSYQENEKRILKIKDYGIGIPEEEINKIEEPFYMVDKSRSRKAGGAGLGMALCKKIAIAHDGQVHITSRINEGTEIKIVFCQRFS